MLCEELLWEELWCEELALSDWFAPANGIAVQMAALAALVMCGISVYALMAHLTGALRMGELMAVLKRS